MATVLWRLALPVLLFLVLVPAASAWTWPVQGPVVQPFSYDEAHPYASGQHRGVDIAASATGESVLAPASGTVSFAGSVPTSGRTVTIETADGYSITLTHLGSTLVHKGAEVAEGEVVGTVGPSGAPEVDGPYVHLGIRLTSDAEAYLDPLTLLPALAPVLPPSDGSSAVPAAGDDAGAVAAPAPGGGAPAPDQPVAGEPEPANDSTSTRPVDEAPGQPGGLPAPTPLVSSGAVTQAPATAAPATAAPATTAPTIEAAAAPAWTASAPTTQRATTPRRRADRPSPRRPSVRTRTRTRATRARPNSHPSGKPVRATSPAPRVTRLGRIGTPTTQTGVQHPVSASGRRQPGSPVFPIALALALAAALAASARIALGIRRRRRPKTPTGAEGVVVQLPRGVARRHARRAA